ncbi:MAG TPA: Clp protease N-terminal domain-containing protein [Solirubrobacteraceae bacterium]|jgi:hypothetical protein|nr:Clp protease N-terminal domain-containing protein [Solirubrobacteraceae bacterium]
MTASTDTTYHPWTTFVYAREEARRRGDRVVGTEHLVLGLLRDPQLSGLLEADLNAAREALAALDRDALSAIGLDASIEEPPMPASVSASPDDRASCRPPRPTVRELLTQRMPLTPAAKTALRVGGKELRRSRLSDPRQVLSALLALEPPDPAAALLKQLGVDRTELRAELA